MAERGAFNAQISTMKKSITLLLSTVIRSLSTYRNAAIAGPIAFGIISVMLGADTNWDLQNYHLYNAYALLNGKLGTDLAPAGFQTYFNPMLDVPYFYAMEHLPPRLVGFLMGAMHGLNFVLLLGICRMALPKLSTEEKIYVPTLLALAGCLTANFLSELGSSMGDDTTALFCLGSILIVLKNQRRIQLNLLSDWLVLLAAGLLMGIGTGLKLTNAPYAVAVCLGLFVFPISWWKCLKAAFVFGVGVLVGIGCMNGYWFYTMWLNFGNPLFPQFNNIFQNPLAASVAVGDTSWLPKTIWQQIFWPFIISADAQKVGQIAIRQVIWAMGYFLLIAVTVKVIYCRVKTKFTVIINPSERFIITVVIVGFFVWMKLFSIYRYLVPMDMLAPLAVFMLCKFLLPYILAKRVAGVSIAIATLIVLSGTRTWWHEPWGEELLHAEVPALTDPEHTTVLMLEGDPPWAWLAIKFPVKVAFVQIQGNFPQGPGYADQVRKILHDRSGPIFAQFSGVQQVDAAIKSDRIRQQVDRLGLTKNADRCKSLGWVIQKLKLRASVVPTTQPSEGACRLEVVSKERKRDVDMENRSERDKARAALKSYGLTIQDQSCTVHRAGIASDVRLYQFCPVSQLVKE